MWGPAKRKTLNNCEKKRDTAVVPTRRLLNALFGIVAGLESERFFVFAHRLRLIIPVRGGESRGRSEVGVSFVLTEVRLLADVELYR